MKELWRNTTLLSKILLVLIGLLILSNLYIYFTFKSFENTLIKGYKKELVTIKDSLYISKEKTKQIQQELINEVSLLKSRTSQINHKFIKHEKAINSMVVTDDDIEQLLSRFGKNTSQ